ncbi:MAG TPA: oxalurate catabolism protein HpxZ [Candidatus Dormibacteraeota bacterium]|jgi:hypothetical protein|nr:oxalurate catabolism protein HpxZ [Candidatus Dormibacteraeota bacterium]
MTLETASQQINQPEVVAEIAAVFAAYEAALIANDADTLDSAFWDSEQVVRYGVNECLYGLAEIREWRLTATPIPPGRAIGPTVITTFGRDFACINTEFRNPGSQIVGRQTQTWVRLTEGWRIVSAHVSILRPPVAG